ncbi:hypothetical protein B7P43_G10363 [Cryptotermes secundus]|uniref:Nose resistant-to-fluoxetine protein N-terminal domain-containing protein n=3 Tax=Cryptotermes secundus TaxID=105785 RepID=A0A2J7PZG9_9NEOP|nr:hypothetical protein B7P43_G10363 [Cryptotermes secundus]
MRNVLSGLQVHVPVLSAASNALCRNQSQAFLDSLQVFDMWALKMFDSSAKFPSGVLNGNINQYGDFNQCLEVTTELNPLLYPHLEDYHVTGKYCLTLLDLEVGTTSRPSRVLKELDDLVHAHRPIVSTLDDPGHRIARFSTVNWGFCVPAACSADDLTAFLSESLQNYLKDTDVTFKVKVDPDLCYIKDFKQVSTGTKVTIILFVSLLGVTAFGTWVKTGQKTPEEAKTLRLIKAFSLKKNLQKLLNTESVRNDVPCLHGIRALNALALIIFHKSVALYFNPYINRAEMAQTFARSWSVIGRTSILYTDSFIFISGFLASHGLFRELRRDKKINVWGNFLSRYLRFTPSLAAVILFCTYIMDHLGSGPQWNLVVKRHSDICQTNMWRNFLFIHNYFGFEEMCLTHTHQLAVDMQLYLVAPFFVYLLWSRRWLGLGSLILLGAYSTHLRYTVAYNRKLSTVVYFGTTVSQLYETGNFSYTLPAHRATVYLIGVAARFVIRETKPSLSLSKVQLLIGWSVAVAVGALAMCGPHHMSSPSYEYSPQEAALYNALSPILWGAFLGWITFADSIGHAGIIGRILSWKGFTIFSRICYAVYLTQFPVFFYNVGTRRSADYYSPHLLFEFGEVVAIILLSVILTLLVDLPFQEVKTILWNRD